MQTLSLYIDKWFITVAVNKGGNIMPLILPNGEDRIWLFFHEDVANSRIQYGRAFENDYRDNKGHYIGDIFALIEQGDCYFTRYANRREEMKEIFKVSGIFTHLHQAAEQEENVETYLSFSADIPDVARLRFIEELEQNGFRVVESVARISHLALEECKMRNIIADKGNYLVLVATNENFHYSLYENQGNIFLRTKEESLPGLGMDVRRRALVESIVDMVNKNSKLLKTQEEFEQECVRQDRYADEWLEQIYGSRNNKPVSFAGISFAVAPNNETSVMVFPKQLDERTGGIVDEIVRKIAEFVSDAGLQPHEINGIVFVGNTFTNQTFRRAINNRFIVSEDKLVTFTDTELPKVVGVYSHIDCDQFRGATEAFKTDARTQEILLQQAKEEEEKKRIAEEEKQKQQAIIESQKKAEREYNNACEKIELYEREHNYSEMLEWAKIALNLRPEDEYAKEKETLANQLIADQRAADKQYSAHMHRAKTAFSEERWSDAVSQAEMALEIRPDSEEARRIKAEARRLMEVKEKVRDLINCSKLFVAQKLYDKALAEVEKVLSLDPSNTEAKEIQNEISEIKVQHEAKINELLNQLKQAESSNDYNKAIQICEVLKVEDEDNISKWASKANQYRIAKQKHDDEERERTQLRNKVNALVESSNWDTLIITCEEFLTRFDDKEVQKILDTAKKEIFLEEILKRFNDAYESEDWNEVLRIYNENESLKQYRSNNTIVRVARNQIRLQRQKTGSCQSKPAESTPPDNISNPPKIKYRGPRPRMPQSLLQEPKNNIDSESLNNASLNVTQKEETNRKEIKQSYKTRKFPKVKRNNN